MAWCVFIGPLAFRSCELLCARACPTLICTFILTGIYFNIVIIILFLPPVVSQARQRLVAPETSLENQAKIRTLLPMLDIKMVFAFERCLAESHKESREKGIKDEVCFYFPLSFVFHWCVQFFL
jgi:hypothetical protein